MSDHLTAADLPRIVISASVSPPRTALSATDSQFARWVHAMTGEFTRYDIVYPERARVMWVNAVNERHPITLTAHVGEDDRL